MSSGKRVGSTVALVVLAVVATVVAVVALQQTRAAPPPRPSSSALEQEPTRTPRPTPSRTTDGRLQPVEPLLVQVDRRTAFRGSQGTCQGGATLDVTSDGGRTWQALAPPVPALVALRALSATAVDLVSGCDSELWSSPDGGQTWGGPVDASGAWFRDPVTPRRIHAPGRLVASPCDDRSLPPYELTSLSPTDAHVLCADGTIWRSLDVGTTWTQLAGSPGAVAMAWESRDLGWLLVTDGPSCLGLTLLRSDDGGSSWATGPCVGTDPFDPDASGLPSLAFADGIEGMAIVAGETFVSHDGGGTWGQVR